MKLQAFAHRAPVSTVAAVLMAALMPLEARADVTCGRCGCVMHTDEAPRNCWECGRPLFTPAPNPAPDAEPSPAGDFGPMSSGFELGVRFVATPRGIRVIRVRPESAADGVLFVDDIIAAAAYRDDNGRKRQLPTRTSAEMETVKHLAGQSKTALMIRRPNGQVRYAFVVFQPIGGEHGPAEGASDGRARSATGSIEIDQTGEAAELFGGQQGAVAAPQGDGGGAEDFFNDR